MSNLIYLLTTKRRHLKIQLILIYTCSNTLLRSTLEQIILFLMLLMSLFDYLKSVQEHEIVWYYHHY